MAQKERTLPNIGALLTPCNSLLEPEISNAEQNEKPNPVFKTPCPVLTGVENKPTALTDNVSKVKYPGLRSLRGSEHGSSRTHQENTSHGQKKYLNYNCSKPAYLGQQAVPSVPERNIPVDCESDLTYAFGALMKQTYDSASGSVYVHSDSSLRPYMNLNQAVDKRVHVSDEYMEEAFFYDQQVERNYLTKATYMSKQTFITFNMRSILIDWLVSVAEEYHFTRQTLFLSVNYIDRFLSRIAVAKDKLQLVGMACAFIAAKYEEVKTPTLGDFLYVSDYAYTQGQLLTMELLVLRVLSFNIFVPTIHTFLDHYIRVANLGRLDHKYFSMYLTELTLLDANTYLQFLPSIIAAAAFFLAATTLKFKDCWPSPLRDYSGYTVLEFYSCICVLYKTHQDAKNNQQCSVYQKYKKIISQIISDPPTDSLLNGEIL